MHRHLRLWFIWGVLGFSTFAWSFSWQDVYQRIQTGQLEQAFFCPTGDEQLVTLLLSQNQHGTLYDEQGQAHPVVHNLIDNKLSIEIPHRGFKQQSLHIEGDMGLIGSILFPSVYCYAVSHTLESQFQTDVWIDCGDDPGSYIPGVGYSSNLLVLSRRHQWADPSSTIVPGGVFRRKNTETPNDTISTYSYGIYQVQDKKLFIYLGAPDERLLWTGSFNEDYSQVWIHQLGNTSKGQSCQVRY